MCVDQGKTTYLYCAYMIIRYIFTMINISYASKKHVGFSVLFWLIMNKRGAVKNQYLNYLSYLPCE